MFTKNGESSIVAVEFTRKLGHLGGLMGDVPTVVDSLSDLVLRC